MNQQSCQHVRHAALRSRKEFVAASGQPASALQRMSGAKQHVQLGQLEPLARLPACCLASATARLTQAWPTPACWLPVGCLYQ